jgi:hypothetical protein
LTTRPAPIASGPTAGAKVAAVPVFQVAGEQPLDLLLVRAHHRPFRVTVGQFGRRVEQAAAAEAVLVCLRRVIGVGVEDGQDAARVGRRPAPAAGGAGSAILRAGLEVGADQVGLGREVIWPGVVIRQLR